MRDIAKLISELTPSEMYQIGHEYDTLCRMEDIKHYLNEEGKDELLKTLTEEEIREIAEEVNDRLNDVDDDTWWLTIRDVVNEYEQEEK